jgi:hypothetical protein
MIHPYHDTPKELRRKVTSEISPEHYHYLFRVLLYERGQTFNIIAFLLKRLITELQRTGPDGRNIHELTPDLDPENDERISHVLRRLNFRTASDTLATLTDEQLTNELERRASARNPRRGHKQDVSRRTA